MHGRKALIRAGVAVCVAACTSVQVWAGDVQIERADSPDQITLNLKDASVDEVLEALAARFGLKIEYERRTAGPARFSGRLHGSLDQVLERILRHESHIIVRSPTSPGGIGRVAVLGASQSAQQGLPANRDSAASNTPAATPAVSESTRVPSPINTPPAEQANSALGHLEQIVRQLASAQSPHPDGVGAPGGRQGSAVAPVAPASVNNPNMEQLTASAVAKVQSLAEALRSICIGSSCNARR
jgi:hypothetical protein